MKELDPELSEVLRLYGNEEGWHKELITEYLAYLGGRVEPMGRVTRTLYRLYGRARRMETIVLVNLMFETIGSSTYRLALRNVRHPSARHMLTILTRDESFHVPLNVHFLKEFLKTRPGAIGRLRVIYHLLLVSILLLPLASCPKAKAFDGISSYDLSRKYAEMLSSLFLNEPELGMKPPRFVLRYFGLQERDLILDDEYTVGSSEAAERAAERSHVEVTAF